MGKGKVHVSVLPVVSRKLEQLRRAAKRLRKARGIPHYQALDLVAREVVGVADWKHVIEWAKACEAGDE